MLYYKYISLAADRNNQPIDNSLKSTFYLNETERKGCGCIDKINTQEDAINLLRGFRYHGLRLGLTGSFAKNKVRKSSDIDILLDYPNPEEWVDVLLKLQDYTYSNTNRDAIDLCSFHMLNMFEEYKNLTDDSKSTLTFIDTNVIRILRNVIGHTYQTANKTLLASYAIAFSNKKALDVVKSRLEECSVKNKQ